MTRHRSARDKAILWEVAWQQVAPLVAPELHALDCWKPEYNFDAEIGRRHLFDYALPAYRVAVEVDGGAWLPHGGRHASDTDREKLNIAASLGWLVFRFSPAMLNRDPWQCVTLVCDALKFRQMKS
jgi:very-short-patch-repair endonuclease